MMTAVPPPGPLLSSRLVEATPFVQPTTKPLPAPNPNAPVGPRPTFAETPLDRIRQLTLTPPVQKAGKAEAAANYGVDSRDQGEAQTRQSLDLLR